MKKSCRIAATGLLDLGGGKKSFCDQMALLPSGVDAFSKIRLELKSKVNECNIREWMVNSKFYLMD